MAELAPSGFRQGSVRVPAGFRQGAVRAGCYKLPGGEVTKIVTYHKQVTKIVTCYHLAAASVEKLYTLL